MNHVLEVRLTFSRVAKAERRAHGRRQIARLDEQYARVRDEQGLLRRYHQRTILSTAMPAHAGPGNNSVVKEGDLATSEHVCKMRSVPCEVWVGMARVEADCP
eukprot:7390067-Prymnesium_polylepis.2